MILLTSNGFSSEVMTITKVEGRKKDYLPLLLLADESESMIDKYLERGSGISTYYIHKVAMLFFL